MNNNSAMAILPWCRTGNRFSMFQMERLFVSIDPRAEIS
jgi:hypothetical protein